ncbi:glutathione S-transferase T3-like [Tripterygium wilfordii]|uniref:Glutathione S-transferase T3-like n=1 Tax=Tripterygium wilfordii TaxID=458696 RepID=A0A7J7CDL0_TRIWF|nr:glutathione S-transferase T3-like [Tripterygium wilfordii]
MEAELKEMLNDLQSLKRSLHDPSHHASIDKLQLHVEHLTGLAKSATVRRNKVKMDPQYCGNYTDFLNSNSSVFEEIDGFDPAEQAQNKYDVDLPPRKSQRTRNFTRDEDVFIVSAWLNTSKDAIHRVDQSSSRLWRRIYNQFLTNGGRGGRTEASIKNRWRDIIAKCVKFLECVKQIDDRHQLGQTEHGRLGEARELYFSINGGKPFQFDHCLDIF